jgi:DNA modification methylase
VLVQGDARTLPLRDGVVACVVTSPPYFGLRNYEGHAQQIGQEPTPDTYVESLVTVFRELRRVLRDDGTVWLNLGDNYANDAKWGGYSGGKHVTALHGTTGIGRRRLATGLKSKDLIGIPWRVAFALQDDGWYLRSDIIWSKPSCMPESVTDRPTRSHEYLFLLTKSQKYFYDADAIREPNTADMQDRAARGHTRGPGGKLDASRQDASTLRGKAAMEITADGRNKRTVWTVATVPYAGAHFATMPEKLVEPCVLAGSRPGDYVLDPFVGSGTVVAVAQRFGRYGVGVDLSYQDLAKERTAQRGLMFV